METDSHHVFWPRREYRTPMQKKVRNMGSLIIRGDIHRHRNLHANVEPPIMLEGQELYDLYEFMQEHNYELGTTEGLEWGIVWANDRRIFELEDNLYRQLGYLTGELE